MNKIYNIFVSLLIKILSINIPSIKYIRRQTTQVLQHYPEEIIPPQKVECATHYMEILKNKKVKPVKRRIPLPYENITCPSCGAPSEFIYLTSYVYSKSLKKKVPQLKCKICERRWLFSLYEKKSFSLRCPYCGRCLNIKKHRKEFDVYKCINPECPYKKKKGNRYTWRQPHPHIEKETPLLTPKIRTRLPPFTISIIAALTMFGLTARQTAMLLSFLFSINITHPTVLHTLIYLASILITIIPTLPTSFSFPWIVDETYIKCQGKWFYLFSLLDANAHLIAQYLSPTRSIAGTYTVLSKAFSLLKIHIKEMPSEFVIVTDGFSAYPPAFQLFSAEYKIPIKHIKIIGLRKKEGEGDYRRYKNLIENFHSTFKPQLKRMRGFGSYRGAVSYFTIFYVWHNYLRKNACSSLLFQWNQLINNVIYNCQRAG